MIKCIVFDLDNTLWKGICSEEEICISKQTKAMLTSLDARGILMALSSKNNSEEIDKILKREKIDELFFIKKINYGRKSISIKNISEESGIAMTEMLFVDDDEYERFEVKHTINEIICVSPKEFWNNYYDEIIRKNEITTDSKTRRLYYLEEKKYRTEVKRKGYDEVFDTLNSVIYCRNKVSAKLLGG